MITVKSKTTSKRFYNEWMDCFRERKIYIFGIRIKTFTWEGSYDETNNDTKQSIGFNKK